MHSGFIEDYERYQEKYQLAPFTPKKKKKKDKKGKEKDKDKKGKKKKNAASDAEQKLIPEQESAEKERSAAEEAVLPGTPGSEKAGKELPEPLHEPDPAETLDFEKEDLLPLRELIEMEEGDD